MQEVAGSNNSFNYKYVLFTESSENIWEKVHVFGMCRSWHLDAPCRLRTFLATVFVLQQERTNTSRSTPLYQQLLLFSIFSPFTVRNSSCGKVMILHLSVSHSVHGGVWADTPYADPSEQTLHASTAADGTHPTGMHSCHDIRLQQNDSQFLTSIMTSLLNFKSKISTPVSVQNKSKFKPCITNIK